MKSNVFEDLSERGGISPSTVVIYKEEDNVWHPLIELNKLPKTDFYDIDIFTVGELDSDRIEGVKRNELVKRINFEDKEQERRYFVVQPHIGGAD